MKLLEPTKYTALVIALILSIISVLGIPSKIILVLTLISGFLAIIMQILESRKNNKDAAEEQQYIHCTLEGQKQILDKQCDILSRMQKGLYPVSGLRVVLSFDISYDKARATCPSYFDRLDRYVSTHPNHNAANEANLLQKIMSDAHPSTACMKMVLNSSALWITPDSPLFPNPDVYPDERNLFAWIHGHKVDVSFSDRLLNEQDISQDWKATGGWSGLLALPEIRYAVQCDFVRPNNNVTLGYDYQHKTFRQEVTVNVMNIDKIDDDISSVFDLNGLFVQLCARSFSSIVESLDFAAVYFTQGAGCYHELVSYFMGKDYDILKENMVIQFHEPFKTRRIN